MSSSKILVCGDVEGQFKTLFAKVGKLNQKQGPFEYLFCVGNFFGSDNDEWKDVKAGKISVPLATYVLGPNKKEHVLYYPDEDSSEMAPNIIYLGKRGVLTGSSGLKIAYFSGLEQTEQERANKFSFDQLDASAMAGVGDDIDILLTSEWPFGVAKHAKAPDNFDSSNIGSKLIAYVANVVKPRYHFSAISGIYYERFPYRNHPQESPMHTTRFIGLAPVNNSQKLKCLYAFNIVPFRSASPQELRNTAGFSTECPYNSKTHSCQFFYDSGESSKPQKRTNGSEGAHIKKKNKVSQDSCWFCFANGDLEKQFILDIGEHSYIALDKGGLVKEHILIIPMEHISTSIKLPEAAAIEIENFKNALVKYFNEKDKDVIVYERNFFPHHLLIQVVPVSRSKTSGILKNILDFGASEGREFIELPLLSVLKQVAPPKEPYFYLEVFSNGNCSGKLLLHMKKKIPPDYGRMLLASEGILNIPDRVDWRNCITDTSQTQKIVKHFRQKFNCF